MSTFYKLHDIMMFELTMVKKGVMTSNDNKRWAKLMTEKTANGKI